MLDTSDKATDRATDRATLTGRGPQRFAPASVLLALAEDAGLLSFASRRSLKLYSAVLAVLAGLAPWVFVLVCTAGPTLSSPLVEPLVLEPQPQSVSWATETQTFADRLHRGFGIDRGTALEFSEWILEAAQRQAFRPELLASLVLTESSFRKGVRSKVGAIGPAQVRPQFWSRFCGASDLSDPAENIYCGAQVLALYRERCGDTVCALRAYNVGPRSRRAGAAARYVAKIDARLSQLGHELVPRAPAVQVNLL